MLATVRLSLGIDPATPRPTFDAAVYRAHQHKAVAITGDGQLPFARVCAAFNCKRAAEAIRSGGQDVERAASAIDAELSIAANVEMKTHALADWSRVAGVSVASDHRSGFAPTLELKTRFLCRSATQRSNDEGGDDLRAHASFLTLPALRTKAKHGSLARCRESLAQLWTI